MKDFRASKGVGQYVIILFTILFDGVILVLLYLMDSYVLSSLLKTLLVFFNIYQLYYLLLSVTIRYYIDDHKLNIVGVWGMKRRCMPLKDIEGFQLHHGRIKGVKLTGYGSNHFALGKSYVTEIGTASMYVTSNKNIVYLKARESIYAISPQDITEFTKELLDNDVQQRNWEVIKRKEINLHNDKKFIIPFVTVAIIICLLTLTPFILYLKGRLPGRMPLNFDASFAPVEYGTGRQFAFSQAIYGVMNMTVLFCMYYASYFYSKYDRKTIYRFVYISLVIALFFFMIQIRIITTFN